MHRMKILDRYLYRQFFLTFLFMLGMVIVLCVVVDFVEKIDDFLDKKFPLKEIVTVYYANFVPFYGNLLAPVALFLAVIFFTSRLAHRSEFIPMLTSGISYYRLLIPYLVGSVIFAVFSFYLKSYLIPVTAKRRIDFEYKLEDKKQIGSNRNIHKKVADDTYLYINYYNDRQKEGYSLSMEQVKDGDIITKINANKITWIDSTGSWELSTVTKREIANKKEKISKLEKLDTTLLLTPDDLYIIEHKEQTLTLPDLLDYIQLEEMRGSDILRELYLEKHRRFAYPFAMIVLSVIGFAVSTRKSRGGTALQIGIGLVICFVYIIALIAGEAIAGEKYPPGIAVWTPNLLFSIIAGILLAKAPK